MKPSILFNLKIKFIGYEKIRKIINQPLKKVIKNEELVNLKGGEYGGCCICGNGRSIYGTTNQDECEKECDSAEFGGGSWLYK